MKRLCIALLVTFGVAIIFLAHHWYNRPPWLEASVRAHSERGSTNCGQLTNSGANPGFTTVIQCVEAAHRRHRPFFVTVVVDGIDESYSSAIVGDSKGQAIEIFYLSGMVTQANELLKRRCPVSGQFLAANDGGVVPGPHWAINTLANHAVLSTIAGWIGAQIQNIPSLASLKN